MAATATARKATARRAPARSARPAPARRSRRRQLTPPAGFVPVAVGAVGGLADSGVVVRLTKGRLWIGALAALLVGIVALNVMALSFSASSSQAGRQADALKREGSALRSKIATLTASEEISRGATDLGLVVPKPNQVGYLRPQPGDAATAAQRLREGELTASTYVAPADAAVVTSAATATEPVATAETEPVAATDVAAAASDAAAVTEAPVTDAAAAETVGGAVSAP